MKRTMWRSPLSDDIPYGKGDGRVIDNTHGNLIGSLLQDSEDLHRPVLDIDFPARLIPSKTEGHYHLYLDGIVLSKDQYTRLLNVLNEVGIIQRGIVRQMETYGATFVRKPREQ